MQRDRRLVGPKVQGLTGVGEGSKVWGFSPFIRLVVTPVQLSFPLLLAFDCEGALGAIGLTRDTAVVFFGHDTLYPTTLATLTRHCRVSGQGRIVRVGRVETIAQATSAI